MWLFRKQYEPLNPGACSRKSRGPSYSQQIWLHLKDVSLSPEYIWDTTGLKVHPRTVHRNLTFLCFAHYQGTRTLKLPKQALLHSMVPLWNSYYFCFFRWWCHYRREALNGSCTPWSWWFRWDSEMNSAFPAPNHKETSQLCDEKHRQLFYDSWLIPGLPAAWSQWMGISRRVLTKSTSCPVYQSCQRPGRTWGCIDSRVQFKFDTRWRTEAIYASSRRGPQNDFSQLMKVWEYCSCCWTVLVINILYLGKIQALRFSIYRFSTPSYVNLLPDSSRGTYYDNFDLVEQVLILSYNFYYSFSMTSIMQWRVGEHCFQTFTFKKHPITQFYSMCF